MFDLCFEDRITSQVILLQLVPSPPGNLNNYPFELDFGTYR